MTKPQLTLHTAHHWLGNPKQLVAYYIKTHMSTSAGLRCYTQSLSGRFSVSGKELMYRGIYRGFEVTSYHVQGSDVLHPLLLARCQFLLERVICTMMIRRHCFDITLAL